MRIGELSRRTGVSPRALRYYEEQDLLRPGRDENGYRDYRDQDVRTVRNIQRLLADGLVMKEIQRFGDCLTTGELTAASACAEALQAYLARRDAIAERIDDLRDQHRRLSDAIADLGGR